MNEKLNRAMQIADAQGRGLITRVEAEQSLLDLCWTEVEFLAGELVSAKYLGVKYSLKEGARSE